MCNGCRSCRRSLSLAECRSSNRNDVATDTHLSGLSPCDMFSAFNRLKPCRQPRPQWLLRQLAQLPLKFSTGTCRRAMFKLLCLETRLCTMSTLWFFGASLSIWRRGITSEGLIARRAGDATYDLSKTLPMHVHQADRGCRLQALSKIPHHLGTWEAVACQR